MKTHILKCIQPYFDEVVAGRKQFEVRLNDKDYQIGDRIIQKEFFMAHGDGSGEFTGNEIDCGTITYILKDYPALKEGYIVFGLSMYTSSPTAKESGAEHPIRSYEEIVKYFPNISPQEYEKTKKSVIAWLKHCEVKKQFPFGI